MHMMLVTAVSCMEWSCVYTLQQLWCHPQSVCDVSKCPSVHAEQQFVLDSAFAVARQVPHGYAGLLPILCAAGGGICPKGRM
jgi:hypothetical protein